MQNYHEKKVLVIGLGISGRAAAHFLLRKKASVAAVEQKKEVLESPEVLSLRKIGLQVYFEYESIPVNSFDLVVVSPGVNPQNSYYAQALKNGIEVIGEMELACRSLNNRMIGITGTNGKTTVTLLITHILNATGIQAKALGNIGIPLTTEIEEITPHSLLVVELSSYQLETMASPVIDTGVILNITPDHLDRYFTMENYAKAKFSIIDCLKNKGKLFIEDSTYQQFHSLIKNKDSILRYGYQTDCDIYSDGSHIFSEGKKEYILPEEIPGRKSHDLENIMASYAICKQYGVSPSQFFEALKTFKKPPHRIEFVGKHEGITFINDSKGTNIDAVIRAVESIQGQIILIAGGVDKGFPYTSWIREFQNKVPLVCAIGEAAQKIKNDIDPFIPVRCFSSLEEAVLFGTSQAKKGESILLSPGCSSYDMFKDYIHRGDEFKKIVKKLIENGRDHEPKRHNTCSCIA